MDWNHIRDELIHSLYEWGVSGDHDEHRKFRKFIIDEGKKMVEVQGRPIDYQHLKANKFPTDHTQAIEYVLRNEINSDPSSFGFFKAIDPLCGIEEFNNAPFKRYYARKIDGSLRTDKVVCYKRRKEYEGIPSWEIDPFNRFQFEKITESQFRFRRWFLSTVEQDAGTIFEARLAWHALQKEPCYNCKCRNSLRWSGGPNTSWQDLVCVECKCMFEVKTKKSLDAIRTTFERQKVKGGSFKNYCKLRNSLKPGIKMFLVLMPREFTINRAGEHIHPVFVTEIDYVLPCLSSSDFHHLRCKKHFNHFKSEAFLKPLSAEKWFASKWFDLPRCEPVYYVNIMTRLYTERFSKEQLEKWESEYFIDEESSSSVPVSKQFEKINKEEGNSIEELREAIKDLKTGDEDLDDWESMY